MDTLKRFDIDAYGEREYRDYGTLVQADDAAREIERLEAMVKELIDELKWYENFA